MSLGGFSSILIEGNSISFPKGTIPSSRRQYADRWVHRWHQRMCAKWRVELFGSSTLLIVGATGDVGSGCARCLAPLVKRVQLNARNGERLRRLAVELEADGVPVEIATGLPQFSRDADIVICAASLGSPSLLLGHTAPRHCLRRGLSEEPVSKRRVARRKGILRWSGSGHRRIEVYTGLSWSSKPASLPRCCPWMSAGGYGSCPGAPVRALLPGKGIHYSTAG